MELKDRVEEVLKEVRPMLKMEGGDVKLVDVSDEGIVKVQLTGACGSCPFSTMTLKHGIEVKIKNTIPEIKEVVAV
jgi:Fe-S cluster biogenesis protein NfuA